MVFAANRVILGGSSFTAREAQFLRAAVSQGFSRAEIRRFMRDNFSRGVGNNAIADVRRAFRDSELAGARMRLMQAEQRLDAREWRSIPVRVARARVVIGTTVQVRLRRTGQVIDRVIRLGFDDVPSEAEFQRRVSDVINRGHQGESASEIVGEVDDPDSGRVRRVTFQEGEILPDRRFRENR